MKNVCSLVRDIFNYVANGSFSRKNSSKNLNMLGYRTAKKQTVL